VVIFSALMWCGVGSGDDSAERSGPQRDSGMISMVTVRVPVDLPEHWIAVHRKRLRDLMAAWNP
jgi:hypothetical protein